MVMNNYSKEELQNLFNNSISYAEVLRKMGYENTQKAEEKLNNCKTCSKI